MKNLFIIIIAIVGGTIFFQTIDGGPGFVVPTVAVGNRSGSGIKKYEFTELFEQNKLLSKLAQKDYYTVIECYIDTCSICKRLEADFTAFLGQRKDVLIRRVHFPESGISQSFNGNSQEEVNQQIIDYHERLGRYNFNHVVKTDTAYQLTSCGTPHIEIYGPDKKLIATDKCGEKSLKTGLSFLRNWIKAERL